jgi:hypothetical protein
MSTVKQTTNQSSPILPNADTTILLQNPADKSTPTSILVSSAALSIASPVWKKFLYPPWSTSNTPVTQLDFTSDEPIALLLLLNIAHLQFRNIPIMLDYPTLLEVAILCDQYACVSLVYPWLETWLILDEEKESKEEGKEGWLFIAWVFGRESIFEALAEKLVLEIKVGKDRSCLTKKGKALPEPMPNGIIGKLVLP